MRTSIVLFSAALALAACKKKEQEASPKPAEGSAPATAGTGAPAPTPTTPPAPTATPPTAAVEPPPAGAKNILETARATANLSQLVKAVEAAGIADALSAPGPITVFAPSDEAFAKLAPKDLEALLADKGKLTAVLTYHVVPGAVASKDLAAQKAVKTAQGAELPVDATAGVKVGGSTVVTADVAASNGVIHIIDTVLLPPT